MASGLNMHFAPRRSRATALCLALLPALAVGCGGEDPVDNNNNFTSNGDDMGTAGTEDEVGTEDATGDGTDADSSTTDGDGDTTTNDDPTDTTDSTDAPTTDTTDTDDECVSPADQVGSSCGQNSGIKGPVAKGESYADLPIGQIDTLDNGIGNGAEDWYRFEFPVIPAAPRPTAGMPTIGFAVNDGQDYKFEVYRDCGAEAYGQGLASEFGSGAPPLTEWSFHDVDPGMFEQIDYMEMAIWPTAVWVRVIRHQNDGVCNTYQLAVTRP